MTTLNNYRSRDFGRAITVRCWTPGAIECLERSCNCKDCFYKDFFEKGQTGGYRQKCQMKASVLELIRTIGMPEGFKQKTFIQSTEKEKEPKMETLNLSENEKRKFIEQITNKEFEVCDLLCNGATYPQIAKKLFISETTVKTHVNNIFQKLQVNDRTQAVLRCQEIGIGKTFVQKSEEQYIMSECIQTTDYSKFKFSKANRKSLSETHIEKLVRSIRLNGYMHAFPIIVNPDMLVIDGQHRFNACRRLKMPIFYVVQNNKIENILPLINNTQLKWNIVDWINYYSQNGNENYILFQQFCIKYSLSPTNGIIILFKGKTSGSQTQMLQQELLNFSQAEFETCSAIAQKVKTITKMLKIDSGKLISAIVFLLFHECFDIKRLLKKLEYLARTFQKTTNTREYLKQLQEVYNHRSREDSTDFMNDYDKMIAKK